MRFGAELGAISESGKKTGTEKKIDPKMWERIQELRLPEFLLRILLDRTDLTVKRVLGFDDSKVAHYNSGMEKVLCNRRAFCIKATVFFDSGTLAEYVSSYT